MGCQAISEFRRGKFTDYQRVCDAHESRDGIMRVSVRFPTARYADDFWALSCAPDLLTNGLFPNFKEMTESFAAYHAVRRHIPFDPQDGDVTVAVIGDGNTPRTAATFAFRSAWQCISIDPRLKQTSWPIRRLECIAKRIENVGKRAFKKLVVVAPHSHAPLDAALEVFSAKGRHVVALPCCVDQIIPGRPIPDLKYDDWGIWSPARAVMVWRDV
jgi:hypothetical protein